MKDTTVTESESEPPKTQSLESQTAPSSSISDDETDSEERGYNLPLDEVFEILKNSRRRETLRYLQENGGETTLSEVAEHIAALENDTTVRAISSTQRKRVYVGLYQCHLPKMDDTGVIDFEQNRGTIELGPNADQLYPYLDEPESREWHKLYMGVTLAGVGLFAATQLGGASIGLTPTVVLIWLLGGITVSVVAHYLATTD